MNEFSDQQEQGTEDEEIPADRALSPQDNFADDLETGALLASLLPGVGGAISNVLGGVAAGRRINRIYAVLNQMKADLEGLGDAMPEKVTEYAESEEFEDLVFEALKRVLNERSEEKRRMYGKILAAAVKSPDTPYDEHLRFMQVLEQVQPAHILLLRAYSQEGEVQSSAWAGSILGTLRRRLGGELSDDQIRDMAQEMISLRLLNDHRVGGIMTAEGAERTSAHISSFGSCFAAFLISK